MQELAEAIVRAAEIYKETRILENVIGISVFSGLILLILGAVAIGSLGAKRGWWG